MMKTVTVGDIALHVRDDGPVEGRVLLFSNSLGTDLRVWDPVLACLPDDLRIIRYDKRGHGLSDCPPAPYDIATLVGDVEQIATALDLSNVTFVGLSIGGLIGQGLAARRPDLVDRLVLMDTAAKIGTAQMWQDRIRALRSDGLDAMADAILDRWFAPALRADPGALAPWRNMLTRTPIDGYIGCCAAIAGADFTSSTGQLSLPVMAMVGENDGATPPDLVQATARLCNAPCHVIAQAGHLPCVERPEDVARLIMDFLKENTHDGSI